VSYLAQLFAQFEGFYKSGTLPQRQNNPMDLMHAPGEDHPADAPNSIGSFATPEEGWAAAERQLGIWAAEGLTVGEAIAIEAPASAGNPTVIYANFICGKLGCTPNMLVSDALLIQAPGDSNAG
jgi:hypothetical protein